MMRRFFADLPIILLSVVGQSPGFACTVFTISTPTIVLMGNNEDFTKLGAIWFVPGRDGKLGRVNVGFHDGFGKVETFAQGSMNEKGLAFDAMVVGKVAWQQDPAKQTPRNLADQIIDKCETVAEAIDYFRKYNCPYLANTQFMFADASGASAVIAWEPNRGLSVVNGKGAFQIATNTRLAATGYRCQRFMRVTQELNAAQSLDIEAARRSLQAVHQHGPGGFTSYACIYDLRNRMIYLYNLTNYDEAVSFDLTEQLAKGQASHLMKNLFKSSPSIQEVQSGTQRVNFGTRIELGRDQLEKFVGEYSPDVAPEIRVRIEATDEGLLVHNPGQSVAKLFPETKTIFRIAPDRGQVSFEVSETGQASGLTLHKGQDVKATRVGH